MNTDAVGCIPVEENSSKIESRRPIPPFIVELERLAAKRTVNFNQRTFVGHLDAQPGSVKAQRVGLRIGGVGHPAQHSVPFVVPMLDQNDLATFGARFGHPFPSAASRLARPQDLDVRLHVPRQIRKRTAFAVVDVRKAHRNRVVRAERAHADVVADDGIVVLGDRFGRTP